MRKFMDKLRDVAEKMTCHTVQYGALAAVYGAAQAGLCDKALVGQVAMAVYLVLALRP